MPAPRTAREDAARRRKALQICDVLWDLGLTAEQAEALPDDLRAQAVRLTGRPDGKASGTTWALVVSTLTVWQRTRRADTRTGPDDVRARLEGAEQAARAAAEAAQEQAEEAAQQDDGDPFGLIPQRPDPFAKFPGARAR